MSNLEQIMEQVGTPTLKAIAMVFDLQPVRLYSVAKQPKEGMVYDPKTYNWDAIERFITRRLSADKGLATLEDVILKALEIDADLKQNDGRRAANRGLGTNKKIEVDGEMVAARKYPNFEMDANQLVCLRKDARVYKIVYQTASHTVLVPVSDTDGTIASQDVKVISNGMLNMRGVGPANLESAIVKRFSGEYAAALAADEAKKEQVATEANGETPEVPEE